MTKVVKGNWPRANVSRIGWLLMVPYCASVFCSVTLPISRNRTISLLLGLGFAGA